MSADRGDFRGQGVGLALGGGAARGLAHIGVFKVLEEEGIPVSHVAGTSVGSLMGALFCAGLTYREMLEKAKGVDWLHIASFTFTRMGFMKMDRLERLVEETLGKRTFASLAIPLLVVTVDIMTGEQVILSAGSVGRAVRASCSIPGIFAPFDDNGRLLVDGGLANNVPVDVVRGMGAKKVLAVSLSADRRHTTPPRHVLDVLLYSFDILMNSNVQRNIAEAEIVIAPEIGGFAYRDFRRADELVAQGEKAMRGQLKRLKKLLRA
jgi:NTE family protein